MQITYEGNGIHTYHFDDGYTIQLNEQQLGEFLANNPTVKEQKEEINNLETRVSNLHIELTELRNTHEE